MSFLNKIAKPAVVALTIASMACMAGAAQAQSGKRVVVAMAPSGDVSEHQVTATQAPARTAVAPRAKHKGVTVARAAKTENPDCFWCNRTVYISGVTF